MDKLEFMEGVHILQDNYNKKLSSEQLRLFYENLKDMKKEKYIDNIKMHIKNNQFMPNIAQIRNSANNTNANFEQRDYNNFDFSKLYANPM